MRLFGWWRKSQPQETAPPSSDGQLLGQSLLRLEINTIIKNNMTGEPMQPLPHALLDMAEEYGLALLNLGVPEETLATRLFGDASLKATDMAKRLTATTDRFSELRKIADEHCRALARGRADVAAGAAGPSKDEITLQRIIQGIEIITDIIKRLPRDGLLWRHLGMTREQLMEPGVKLGPYDLSPTQTLRLRKVWDIGTEEIVAQTSIHLTGDVLMRVSPKLLEPQNELLLQIHREAVSMSTAYWRDLMNAAVTLVSSAARALLPPRR